MGKKILTPLHTFDEPIDWDKTRYVIKIDPETLSKVKYVECQKGISVILSENGMFLTVGLSVKNGVEL